MSCRPFSVSVIFAMPSSCSSTMTTRRLSPADFLNESISEIRLSMKTTSTGAGAGGTGTAAAAIFLASSAAASVMVFVASACVEFDVSEACLTASVAMASPAPSKTMRGSSAINSPASGSRFNPKARMAMSSRDRGKRGLFMRKQPWLKMKKMKKHKALT